MTTFSHVLGSFAREGGTPLYSALSRVSSGSLLPVNAIVFSFLVCGLICLLELGSSTSLNAILGAGILFIFMSYAIPIICALMQNRRLFAAPHYFNLGTLFGPTLNVISVAWICFVFVWLCFPLHNLLTGNTINCAIVVFGPVVLLSTTNWFFWSNRHFKSPVTLQQPSEILGNGT